MRSGLVCALILTACAAAISPMSLDVSYSADAAKLGQSDSLSAIRIGVARFTDLRPVKSNDVHARSYVAHDSSFDLGMTWSGRTFAPAADVVQSLLVSELQHAGLNADRLEATVDADDLAGARVSGLRDHFDVVLGGAIRELEYNRPGAAQAEPVVSLEVSLFEVMGGKVLMHAPFKRSGPEPGMVDERARIERLLDDRFRPVAHEIVGKVADQLASLIAAAAQQAAAPPPAEPEPVNAVPDEPPVSPKPSRHRRHRP